MFPFLFKSRSSLMCQPQTAGKKQGENRRSSSFNLWIHFGSLREKNKGDKLAILIHTYYSLILFLNTNFFFLHTFKKIWVFKVELSSIVLESLLSHF